MRHTPEVQLISLLQDPATRRDAFADVVAQYSPKLYRQIRRMLLSHDDTNDVLQNALIKAWTNLDHFRGDAQLGTWLYRIAMNETLNYIAQQKHSTPLSEAPQQIADQLMADPYFDGDQTQLQLQQAMATLPDKQRVVFQLKYFEEMKYEEMSQVLDTSVGALKASYHHAVKKISEYFHQLD